MCVRPTLGTSPPASALHQPRGEAGTVPSCGLYQSCGLYTCAPTAGLVTAVLRAQCKHSFCLVAPSALPPTRFFSYTHIQKPPTQADSRSCIGFVGGHEKRRRCKPSVANAYNLALGRDTEDNAPSSTAWTAGTHQSILAFSGLAPTTITCKRVNHSGERERIDHHDPPAHLLSLFAGRPPMIWLNRVSAARPFLAPRTTISRIHSRSRERNLLTSLEQERGNDGRIASYSTWQGNPPRGASSIRRLNLQGPCPAGVSGKAP